MRVEFLVRVFLVSVYLYRVILLFVSYHSIFLYCVTRLFSIRHVMSVLGMVILLSSWFSEYGYPVYHVTLVCCIVPPCSCIVTLIFCICQTTPNRIAPGFCIVSPLFRIVYTMSFWFYTLCYHFLHHVILVFYPISPWFSTLGWHSERIPGYRGV